MAPTPTILTFKVPVPNKEYNFVMDWEMNYTETVGSSRNHREKQNEGVTTINTLSTKKSEQVVSLRCAWYYIKREDLSEESRKS